MSGWLDKRGGLEATKVTEIAVDESRISCTVIRSELMTSSLYPCTEVEEKMVHPQQSLMAILQK